MIKRKIIFIIFALLLTIATACGKYKEYKKPVHIILVTSDINADSKAFNTTENFDITIITEKAASQTNKTETVYYTKSGKRYHFQNPCGRGTYYECTLDEALEKGLTPCSKCTQ